MREYSDSYAAWLKRMRSGDTAAHAQLEDLAKKGDPHALMALGDMRLAGKYFERDLVKGFKNIAKAAEKGLLEAQRAHIYLTGKGIGRKANPTLARNMLSRLAETDKFSAVQRALLDHATSREKVGEIVPETISDDPSIVIWRGLFSEAEFGYLQHIGLPLMQPALVVDPKTGTGRLDPIRRSDTTSFPLISEDLMLQEILGTVAAATDTTPTQGESLTLLRYRPGQEYRPHYDAYNPGWAGPQRKYTCIIWINDDYEGGETHFPRLDITVKGKAGDMLVFDNLDADGKRNPLMEHAGLPVTRGEKWIATRWVVAVDTIDLKKFG